MDFGFLLLRSVVGLTLAAHGTRKLFGWFGGGGLDATGQGFASLGFNPGRRHALAAGVAETGAGLLLALGLFTPLAAAAIGAIMFVAAMAVHVKQGFFNTSGGFEYNLVLGIAGLSFAFTGPGAISLDAFFGWGTEGLAWGLVAVAAGLASGAMQLAQRSVTRPQAVKAA